MGHREDIRAYLESLEVSGFVVDWGSGSKPVQKYVKGDANFFTIDTNPTVNPTLLADIQTPIFLDNKADHAFCIEVIEHTTDHKAVLSNIWSNLKEGGKLHLSVPFLYPEHGDNDYIRLTKTGLDYFVSYAGFKDIEITEIEQGFILEAVK